MLTAIITAILGVCIGVYISIRNKSKYYDILERVFAGLIGLIIGFSCGAFIACALPMRTEVITTKQSIEALQDNSSIHGSFFLGSGQIDGTMKYVMYVNEDGLFHMVTLNPRYVSIEYTDGDASLITYEREPVKGDLINLFAVDHDLGTIGYVVQVPKGTIKANYNLDAQ